MDGNRQFPNVDGRFSIALLGWQAIGINRQLDMKSEVIPDDVAVGCQEIKRVLLDVHAALDVNFEISDFKLARALQRRAGAGGRAGVCATDPSATIWPSWFALPARVSSGSSVAGL